MNSLVNVFCWATISGFLTTAALCSGIAKARDGADEEIEEIITIGTRRQGRTAVDTAVPIDVFNAEDLDSVSSDDMLDIINTLVPSFVVRRFPLSDGQTFVRPPELRGLSFDKTLVLVNGKRRHRSAVIRLGGNGSHGPDLAVIPGIALKSVEVLRDGASALYGSDAIAGVFNFNVRDAAEGGEIRVQTGMYTEGNESGYLISLNQGLRLGNSGFINISAELSDNEPTSRGTTYNLGIAQSGLSPIESAQVAGLFDHDLNPATPDLQRFGPDALTEIYDPVFGELVTIARGSDGIPDDTDTRYADNLQFAEVSHSPLVQIWGEPEREAIRSFINAGLTLDSGTQLYAWVNYSDSNANNNFFHRPPGIPQLAPMRTQIGEIYDPRSRYPAGFTPRFAGNVIDMSFTGGISGEWDNGLSYDFSGRVGESTIKYTICNTMNPSLGPATPTSFRPGDLVSSETAFNADFSLPVDAGFASNLNIAFGFEYREEGYDIVEGGLKSYEVGPYALEDPWNLEIDADEAAAGQNGGSVGCFIPGQQFDPTSLCHPDDPIHNTFAVGSNGFPGYGSGFTSIYDRDSWAAYFDFEADITDTVLATVAGRYEDFSDFGSNFSFRLAARLRFSDAFTARASAGTGFRAPTPGQISAINVSTVIDDDGQPVAAGIFPPDNPVSQFFGATPLKDETSTQITFGIAAQPTDSLTLTLDYYFIVLDDQISSSSEFELGPEEVATLEVLGVPGASEIASVEFFTNDLDTETSGIDLVASYGIDWRGGNTIFSVSANANKSTITRRTNRQSDPTNPTPEYYVNDRSKFNFENNLPDFRANLTARHTWANGITASLRSNWFGEATLVRDRALTVFEHVDGNMSWDVDVTWDVNEEFSFTVGGNNIFNEFPDPPSTISPCCGVIYSPGTSLDWQGSYYYVRGAVRWN